MKKVEKIFRRVCKKYGIKNRRFTKEDFYRICKAENILLLDDDYCSPLHDKIKKIKGVYITMKNGDKFIYLKSFFQKRFNHFVAFHELGHHFCRHLTGLNYTTKRSYRNEREADYFSYLATGLKRRKKRNE